MEECSDFLVDIISSYRRWVTCDSNCPSSLYFCLIISLSLYFLTSFFSFIFFASIGVQWYGGDAKAVVLIEERFHDLQIFVSGLGVVVP